MNNIEITTFVMELIQKTKERTLKWNYHTPSEKEFKYDEFIVSNIFRTFYNGKTYKLFRVKQKHYYDDVNFEWIQRVKFIEVNKFEIPINVYPYENSLNDLYDIVLTSMAIQKSNIELSTQVRKRCIDQVRNQDKYLNIISPLIKNSIPVFDSVFSKGTVGIDLDYYIPRTDNFEDTFLNPILGLSNKIFNPSAELELLVGPIGSGKTTFIFKLLEILNSKDYSHVLSFYVDTFRLPKDDYEKLLSLRIIQTITNELIEKIYDKSVFQFYYDFVINYLKFKEQSNSEIVKIYEHEINVQRILHFVDSFISPKYNITKVLLIVDNIDENHCSVVESINYYCNDLVNYGYFNFKNTSFKVLAVIRNYNIKFYLTRHCEPTKIRGVDNVKLIQRKLEEFREKVEDYVPEFRERIYTHYLGKEKEIYITKGFLICIVENLIDYIFNYDDNNTINLLVDLSSGNLKILVGNVFNLLNSKKLPVSKLFTHILENYDFENSRYLIPENKTEKLLPFELALECLLAINLPYFDLDSSLMLNIFNLNNSKQIDDFQNIFTIPRILFLIKNYKSLTRNQVIIELSAIGYSLENIDNGLQKCFTKGLFKTDYGVTIEDLNREFDPIELSSSGILYAGTLMCKYQYLQYVSEDTPMEPRFIVDIEDKYPYSKDSVLFNKSKIEESVENFLNFIKQQEILEFEYISKYKTITITDFLDKMSIKFNHKGIAISEYIAENLKHLKKHKKPSSNN